MEWIQTPIAGFTLRAAAPEDTPIVLDFIRRLAAYEHMEDQVRADAEILRDSLFGRKAAHALLAHYDGEPVGFAVYFFNFSTFEGRPGLYLEDVFVLPEMRGRGYGKALLAHLARIATESGCARMEWACLNWNAPSQAFYESLGAVAMRDWIPYRLQGAALEDLASGALRK